MNYMTDAITSDDLCLLLLQEGHIYVDVEKGEAFTRRVSRAGKPKRLGALNTKGYLVCTLWLGETRRQVKVHRLIWIACNGAIPDGMMIDHINGQKADNRIANLRLADAGLNSRNRRSYSGEGNPACKLNQDVASEIRRLHGPGSSYQALADRFGISKSLVAQIVRGELWK